jgi:hypothetical protein
VTDLSPALRAALERLLAESARGGEVHIDRIGELIGAAAAGPPEIEAIFAALEAEGRVVVAPEDADLPARLRLVLAATRALASRLGRRPSLGQIADEVGLGEDEVRHALAFGRIMGR